MTNKLTAQEVAVLREQAAPEVNRLKAIEQMESRVSVVQERLQQETLLLPPAQEVHNAALRDVYDATVALKLVNKEAAKTLASLNSIENQIAATGGQINSTIETITRLKNGGV